MITVTVNLRHHVNSSEPEKFMALEALRVLSRVVEQDECPVIACRSQAPGTSNKASIPWPASSSIREGQETRKGLGKYCRRD